MFMNIVILGVGLRSRGVEVGKLVVQVHRTSIIKWRGWDPLPEGGQGAAVDGGLCRVVAVEPVVPWGWGAVVVDKVAVDVGLHSGLQVSSLGLLAFPFVSVLVSP